MNISLSEEGDHKKQAHPEPWPDASAPILLWATAWRDRGFYVVPIPYKQKGPIGQGWNNLRLKAEDLPQHFNGDKQNIGALMGEPHGLGDVDLDCQEALSVWSSYAPPTNLIFGRPSKRKSHYFYRLDPPLASLEFRDPLKPKDKGMIIELRCLKKNGEVGHQTVVPCSVHESGEQITFDKEGEPANVDSDTLMIAVRFTAATCLLVRYWPENGNGRHEAMLALAGILTRNKWMKARR
jgi:hypothetical protein